MRKALVPVLVGVALMVGATSSASGQHYDASCALAHELASSCPPYRNLEFEMGVTVSPSKLPARQLTAVALELHGAAVNLDGSHPPALREAVIDFDKDIAVDATGIPTCKLGKLERLGVGSARHLCREAAIGGGSGVVLSSTPGTTPIPTPLTVFNGGVQNGLTRLFVHIARPEPVVSVMQLVRKGLASTRSGGFHRSSKAVAR